MARKRKYITADIIIHRYCTGRFAVIVLFLPIVSSYSIVRLLFKTLSTFGIFQFAAYHITISSRHSDFFTALERVMKSYDGKNLFFFFLRPLKLYGVSLCLYIYLYSKKPIENTKFELMHQWGRTPMGLCCAFGESLCTCAMYVRVLRVLYAHCPRVYYYTVKYLRNNNNNYSCLSRTRGSTGKSIT